MVDRLADERDIDRATIALAFVLALPSEPVAIIRSQQPDRIRASADACSVDLTRTEVDEILAAAGHPLP